MENLKEIILDESKVIPSNYVKISDIIDTYAPELSALILLLDIKKDGAVDEISDSDYKYLDTILSFYINIKAQRVEEIVGSKIEENLKESGGFSHETAGSLSVFISKKYGIKIVTDGMHRLIKAFLCGVDEVAYSVEKILTEEMTDDEMTVCENNFLKAKNSRNAKMSVSEQNRVDKESGNMSPKQIEYDKVFKKAGIHVNGFGVEADLATPTYPSDHENWWRHLANENSAFYVKLDDFTKYAYRPLIKYASSNASLDIPISWILVNVQSIRDPFLRWLDTENYRGYNTNWWWTHGMHGRSIETSIVRLLCAFNEHHRNTHDKNIVKVEMVSFLNTTSPETKSLVVNCLDKNIPIADILNRSKASEVARLNKVLGIE